ncbi:heterokaryon incompatibility protein-domain-containing protein [Apiospora arundinis]
MNPSKNPFEVSSNDAMCQNCCQFIQALSTFYSNEEYPEKGWEGDEQGSRPTTTWGVAFRHKSSFEALASSAPSCELCHVLHDDLVSLDPDLLSGWLGLYPRYYASYIGDNKRKGYFRAGFSETLDRMPWGSGGIGSPPLHTFRIGRLRDPVDGNKDEGGPWWDTYKEVIAVAPRTTPEYIARRYNDWVAMCRDHPWHEQCRGSTSPTEKSNDEGEAQAPLQQVADQGDLPTRVIDLGPRLSTEPLRLYTAGPDEKAVYVALSHCWGGAIPSSTVLANLEARMSGLPMEELPRNFRDAITVTRALGIRYLWIDSLCIIQDSRADWHAEASRMASVYANAAVVISALEAASSNVGFLHPEVERVPLAALNEDYAVQKVFGRAYEYLQACPLNSRAWCMQERLLARRVLHFGREQMFWECSSNFTSESGDTYTGDNTGHVAALFIKLRKTIREPPEWENESDHWYRLLEEYTTRKLTVSTDKLPALAGAATLTQSRGLRDGSGTPTYVAGLWREDLVRGLVWGAEYDHGEGRKVWGLSSSDRCSTLVEAPLGSNGIPRAPSWSWASVDGAVIFWALRSKVTSVMLEKLEVVMMAGEGDLTESQPIGALKVRGPLAEVVYHPCLPLKEGMPADVGHLTFANEQVDSDFPSGCVMDVNRDVERTCYALLVYVANEAREKYMLVLEKRDADMAFKRIGICKAEGRGEFDKGFKSEDIIII